MPVSQTADILHTTYQGDDVFFTGCSTDSRSIKKGQLFIALRGEQFDGHDYTAQAEQRGAYAVLGERKSRHSLAEIIVQDTRRAMGHLAGHWRAEFSLPLIAITGSNGKTTVKEMLAAILRIKAPVLATQGNFNNDIGVPLTLFCLGKQHQYAVIEMGANHPGEIAWLTKLAQPTVALVTQCAPAHLAGFGSIAGVAQAKSEIFSGLKADGTAIINGDDPYADLWWEKSREFRRLRFGLTPGNEVTARSVNIDQQGGFTSFTLVSTTDEIELTLSLPGKHNVMNALAAAAVATSLDIALPVIKQGLESMTAIKGRLEIKTGLKQCRIIDDTYNANPASLEAGLQVLAGFGGRRWLVLGDMGELGHEARAWHALAGEKSKQYAIDRLYTVGELALFSAESFGGQTLHADSLEQLAVLLQKAVDADVTILIKGSHAMGMGRLVNKLVSEG